MIKNKNIYKQDGIDNEKGKMFKLTHTMLDLRIVGQRWKM